MDRWEVEYPLLLRILWGYTFFLPLLSVQVPSIVAGFAISPARLSIALAIGVILVTKSLHPGSHPLLPQPFRLTNSTLQVLLVYLLLSVTYYYALAAFDVGIRFGTADSFFRSWRGRPLAQFTTLLTFGVVPYLLTRRYATDVRRRNAIGMALVGATAVLLAYGYAQQLAFYLGLPVTGRLLYEGAGVGQRLPAYSVGGITLLRFYSLGGEPRDYGTFIIGGALFFAAWTMDTRWPLKRASIVALGVSFFLTASTTAFIALSLTGAFALLDATRHGWLRAKTVGAAIVFVTTVVALFFLTKAGGVLGARSVDYWHAIQTLGEHREEYSLLLKAQSSDLSVLFYVLDLPRLPAHHLFFGHGFGNFSSGVSGILQHYFGYDIMREGMLEESRSYAVKLLVETGIVGLSLFAALFARTLRASAKLVRTALSKEARTRQILLRYAYVGFFVAGMIQVSFFHFIVMGLIDGAAADPMAPRGGHLRGHELS